MEPWIVLLGVALVAATWGFVRLVASLEDRP
jgi:hypothetical protein